MITKNKILSVCGRPSAICNALQKRVEENSISISSFPSFTIDIEQESDIASIILIPTEVIENFLAKESISDNLESVKEMFTNTSTKAMTEKLIMTAEKKYDMSEFKFTNDKTRIMETPSFAFLFGFSGELEDVVTATPNKILSEISKYE